MPSEYNIIRDRMLTQAEAASYTKVKPGRLRRICPVLPVKIDGTILWDRHDLDEWIDTVKREAEASRHSVILDRLP